MIGEVIFAWVLLRAHENHVFEEMRETLTVWRIVERTHVDSNRTVSNLTAERLLIFVLHEQTLHAVWQSEVEIFVEITRRLVEVH